MNKLLVLLSILVALQSCKTESIQPEEVLVGTEFYPVFVSQVREYQVFEVKYKPNVVDTVQYKVKEEISALIKDVNGVKEYTIKRYRANGGQAYVQDSLWSVKTSNREVIKHQHNQSLKILSFPIQTDDQWNLNAYVSKPKDNLSYTNLNQSFQGYTHTIRTSHERSANIINQNERYNIYAENVGLVYKYYRVISQQPGEPRIGVYRTYTLIK